MRRIYMAKEIRGAYEENMNLFCSEAAKQGWLVQEFHCYGYQGLGRIMVLFYKDVE